jgi:hypothetical protein
VTHRLSSDHQRFVCSLDQNDNNQVSLENVIFLDQSDSNHDSLCQSDNKHDSLCQSGDEISLDQGEDEISLDQCDNVPSDQSDDNRVSVNQSDKNDNIRLISLKDVSLMTLCDIFLKNLT